MKIINLEEFLKLPCDILFSKYSPVCFGDLCIKKNSINDIDFFYVQISDAIDCYSSFERLELLENAVKNGMNLGIDLNIWSRDGEFEYDQLFAVWELEDLKSLYLSIGDCIFSYFRNVCKSGELMMCKTKKTSVVRNNWVPVGIDLYPDDMKEVLVYTKTHSVYIGYLSQGDWFEADTSCCHTIDATHWMPLPAPPQACT